MADVLLILHFLGLMIAAGGVTGALVSLTTSRTAARGKGAGGRGPGVLYAQFTTVGLVFLLPSGIGLFMVKPATGLGAMFWMKLVFAAMFAFAVISTSMVHSGRSKQAGAMLVRLGPLAGLSLGATVIFSVLAYH
jgi:hypothetical protein